jgi:transposase
MRKLRKNYRKEFKESEIELYQNNDRSIKSIAEELGVHPTSLRQWLRESEEEKAGGLRAFPGQGNPRDEEVARLKKENADLRETNEILKKAMAFFVVKNPR